MVSDTANLSRKIKTELAIGFNCMRNLGRVTVHPIVPVTLPVCTCCLGLINNNVPFILKCHSLENKLNDHLSHWSSSQG